MNVSAAISGAGPARGGLGLRYAGALPLLAGVIAALQGEGDARQHTPRAVILLEAVEREQRAPVSGWLRTIVIHVPAL